MSYDNTIDSSRAALAYLDLGQSPIKPSTRARQFNISQVPLTPANNVTQWLDLAVKKGGSKVSEPLDLKAEIEQRINQSKQYYDEAKQQGVEVAKRSFFKELLNVGIAGVGLGLSIAATLFTAGATMPLLVASGVTFGLAVADAGCAYANWHSTAKGGEGLKLGSDTVANGVCQLLNKVGMASDNAENWAKYTSVFLRSGLVIGTLCTGSAVTTATLGTLSSTFSATKLMNISVDTFAAKAATVALGNATEHKNWLQGQQLQQQQTISKLNKIQHGLVQQQSEQQHQLDLARLASVEQEKRQLAFDLEMKTKILQSYKVKYT